MNLAVQFPELNSVQLKLLQRYIDDEVNQEAKAFGGCRNCYGKGYATVIESTVWSDTDSDIGSPGGSGNTTAHTIRYCSCDRGKQLQQLVAQEANKARETDEYGNPMVQLNMYEAKAVASLLNELANSDYRRMYDTGDWFLDVPRKIAQRLLTAEKGQA